LKKGRRAQGAGVPSTLPVSESENGNRRCGIDRRIFSYEKHIPERRHGLDRRINLKEKRE